MTHATNATCPPELSSVCSHTRIPVVDVGGPHRLSVWQTEMRSVYLTTRRQRLCRRSINDRKEIETAPRKRSPTNTVAWETLVLAKLTPWIIITIIIPNKCTESIEQYRSLIKCRPLITIIICNHYRLQKESYRSPKQNWSSTISVWTRSQNNLGWTWRRTCSPDIRIISVLKEFK